MKPFIRQIKFLAVGIGAAALVVLATAGVFYIPYKLEILVVIVALVSCWLLGQALIGVRREGISSEH